MDNYYFDKDESVSFSVSLKTTRLLLMIIFLFVPVIFFIIGYPIMKDLSEANVNGIVALFKFIIVITFIYGLWLLVSNAGKRMVVYGTAIEVTKFFFITKTI